MGKNECKAVWFNKEAETLHRELIDKKIISQSFREFVKSAFHERYDALMLKVGNAVDLSHETVEKLAVEQVQQETARATKG